MYWYETVSKIYIQWKQQDAEQWVSLDTICGLKNWWGIYMQMYIRFHIHKLSQDIKVTGLEED